MDYNNGNRGSYPKGNDYDQRNRYHQNYGNGRVWNDHKDKIQNEEPSYTRLYPLKKDWITIGADKALVEYAERAGKDLADNNLSSSQIRRIYGEIKRIQMGKWEKNKSSFYLLKPKVAYTYGRVKGLDKKKSVGIKYFKDIYDDASQYVTSNETYENFCNFMEAILAYHRANQKKKQ